MNNGTFGAGHYGVAPEVKQEPPTTTAHNETFGYGRNRVAQEVKQEPPTTPVHHHANAFIADQSEEYHFEDANFMDQPDNIVDSGNLTSSPLIGPPKTQDMIMSYARLALHELVKMARCEAPLWKPSEEEPNTPKLNLVEYYRVFQPMDPNLENSRKRARIGLPSLSRFSNTASKETVCLNISPTRLATSFMDLVRFLREFINSLSGDSFDSQKYQKEWSTIFSSIVSKANILAVVSPGSDGILDEATCLMTAEFHLPTTLVNSWASYFLRHCRMLDTHSWAIVDVSLENLFPDEVYTYRIRPSGCLIESMPGRSSKVTIVQHVKEDNKSLHHSYVPIVASGHAFCAKRWIHALTRSLEFTSHYNAPQSITLNGDGDLCEFQRKGLMRLGERLLRTYFEEVNGSTTSSWRPVPLYGDNPLKLMMSRNSVHVLGNVEADSLAFSTSVYLPFSPLNVFDFLSDPTCHHKWNLQSKEGEMEEIATMYTAGDVRNKIAIIRSKNGGKSPYFIQNSFYTVTDSCIVHARIQAENMGDILRGNNPDDVLIWPSGFAILPSKPPVHDDRGENRTLLTISIQSDYDGRIQRQHAPRINELEFSLLMMTETIRGIEHGLATKERDSGQSGHYHID